MNLELHLNDYRADFTQKRDLCYHKYICTRQPVYKYTHIHGYMYTCIHINTCNTSEATQRRETVFMQKIQQIVRAKINVTLYVDILRQGYTSY